MAVEAVEAVEVMESVGAVGAVEAAGSVAAAGAGEWLEYFDDDGTPYYVNETTAETVWERPAAFQQEASADSDVGSRDSDSVLGVDLSTDSLPSVPSVTASSFLSSHPAVHTPGGAGAAAQGVLEQMLVARLAPPAAPASPVPPVPLAAPAAPDDEVSDEASDEASVALRLSVRGHSAGTPPPPPPPAAPPPGLSGSCAPPPLHGTVPSYTAVIQRTARGLGLSVDDDNYVLEIDPHGGAASCTELTCGDRVVALNGETNPNPNPDPNPNPNPNPNRTLDGRPLRTFTPIPTRTRTRPR